MKRKTLILSFLLGILYDVLFWDRSQGISFFVFVLAGLTFSYFTLRETNLHQSKLGLVFIIPIGFFSLMSFIFTEPLISFLNRTITLVLIGVWAAGYERDRWIRFRMSDYLKSGARLAFSLVSFPWLRSGSLGIFSEQENLKFSGAAPVMRGLAIALPILIVFSFLFASADLVFANTLEYILTFFNFKHFGDYIQRLLIIFLIANFFLGLIVFTINNNQKPQIDDDNKPILNPFLGIIESGIVLVSVILLFSGFVFLQFRYLFFNQQAIIELGFTYSEYARRGFGELIAITMINIGLIIGLDTITLIRTHKEKQIFSWLYTGLVLANLVILISAFTRLNLYEAAFGYTRLRMYSHVFIIWLGILLLAICALVWKRNLQQFANVFLLFLVGFTATLNLFNTDAQIVNRNILRAQSSETLDNAYLGSLSSDAVPALVSHFQKAPFSESFRAELGAAILCFQLNNGDQLNRDEWQSFSISSYRAKSILEEISSDLTNFSIKKDDGNSIVIDQDGIETNCSQEIYFD